MFDFRIYKYPLKLKLGEPQQVNLPTIHEVLHVAIQEGVITMWARVDTNAMQRDTPFMIVGTGHAVPPGAIHRGTVFDEGFVWHIFEV